MTTTQAIEQVGRLAVLNKGFSLDLNFEKEMIAVLLNTFSEVAQARQCITDLIDGRVMPDKRAVTDWARQHEAQRPDGARRGRAAPECPKCDGTGFRPVKQLHEIREKQVEYDAVMVCECRSVAAG